MGSQDKEKKRQRVSSSDTKAEIKKEAIDSQVGAYISLTGYTKCQVQITRLADKYKASDSRILNPEARLDQARAEIDSLKKQLGVTRKVVDETKESLEFSLKGNTVTWPSVLQLYETE